MNEYPLQSSESLSLKNKNIYKTHKECITYATHTYYIYVLFPKSLLFKHLKCLIQGTLRVIQILIEYPLCAQHNARHVYSDKQTESLPSKWVITDHDKY